MIGTTYAVAIAAADWMARALIAVELLPLHIQLSHPVLWAACGVIVTSLSVKCFRCAASHLNLGLPTFGIVAGSQSSQPVVIQSVYKAGVRLGGFVSKTMNAMDGEGVRYLDSEGRIHSTSVVQVEIRAESPFLVKTFSDEVESDDYYGREQGYDSLEAAERAAEVFANSAKGYDTRTAWVMNRHGDIITEHLGYGFASQLGVNGIAGLIGQSDVPYRASNGS